MLPLVCMPPINGKPLHLYISAISLTLGTLLAHCDYSRKKNTIYYVNHTLVAYELNYTPIE